MEEPAADPVGTGAYTACPATALSYSEAACSHKNILVWQWRWWIGCFLLGKSCKSSIDQNAEALLHGWDLAACRARVGCLSNVATLGVPASEGTSDYHTICSSLLVLAPVNSILIHTWWSLSAFANTTVTNTCTSVLQGLAIISMEWQQKASESR